MERSRRNLAGARVRKPFVAGPDDSREQRQPLFVCRVGLNVTEQFVAGEHPNLTERGLVPGLERLAIRFV
jgi:hypothetical protein